MVSGYSGVCNELLALAQADLDLVAVLIIFQLQSPIAGGSGQGCAGKGGDDLKARGFGRDLDD